MAPVIQAEKVVVVRMERVSVSVGLVVHNLFEISHGLIPLPVEQVDFPTQCVGGSFGGASQIGGVPAHGKLADGVGQIVKDMPAEFIGRAARGIKVRELLVYVAGLVVVRHAAPAVEHAEIGHGAQETGFAGHAVDGFLTDRHACHIADHGVGAVHQLVKGTANDSALRSCWRKMHRRATHRTTAKCRRPGRCTYRT